MSDNIVNVTWDKSRIAFLLQGRAKAAVKRALRKAGSTALRDMRSEASKRIRAMKAIAPKYIKRALELERAKGSDASLFSWSLLVSGEPMPLIAYPHKQTKEGVSVEVNRGKRTLVKGAFIATMKSGHEGIFKRKGTARLPIKELLGSRPVDALLHEGEADGVAARGGKSFDDTFRRVLPMELEK